MAPRTALSTYLAELRDPTKLKASVDAWYGQLTLHYNKKGKAALITAPVAKDFYTVALPQQYGSQFHSGILGWMLFACEYMPNSAGAYIFSACPFFDSKKTVAEMRSESPGLYRQCLERLCYNLACIILCPTLPTDLFKHMPMVIVTPKSDVSRLLVQLLQQSLKECPHATSALAHRLSELGYSDLDPAAGAVDRQDLQLALDKQIALVNEYVLAVRFLVASSPQSFDALRQKELLGKGQFKGNTRLHAIDKQTLAQMLTNLGQLTVLQQAAQQRRSKVMQMKQRRLIEAFLKAPPSALVDGSGAEFRESSFQMQLWSIILEA